VEILEESLGAERAKAQQTAENHARTIQDKDAQAAALQRTIEGLPTMEEHRQVLRQLRVVQAVEYNMVDALNPELEEADTADLGAPQRQGADAPESVEVRRLEEMLMKKIKQLEAKLTDANQKLDEAHADRDETKVRETGLQARLNEQVALVARLEEQIAAAGPGGNSHSRMGGTSFGAVHLSALLAPDAQGKPAGAVTSEAQDGGTVLTSAIAEQRDRFRAANAALEADKLALEKRLSSLESELRVTRNDNVKMYEKIKFLESYRSGMRATPAHTDANSIDALPSADKYRSMYEESLNPFNVFTSRQKVNPARVNVPIAHMHHVYHHDLFVSTSSVSVLVATGSFA
jgi:homeobox protein cut-like